MHKPLLAAIIFGSLAAPAHQAVAGNVIVKSKKPNVLIILTDDAGIGDFGFNRNPLIKTPNLDKLAQQSTRFTNFLVSPVCAPTRASLLTGRYAEITGVYDTYNGGAVMATEEITIAEILQKNGYETGIFGKWHLGDNYPYRPIDQGFTESIVFKGGGIGQPGDYDNYFAGDSSYFNPVLYRNEKEVKTKGYCSDVFTDETINFIRNNKSKPFFAYLAFNAPHTPLQVPDNYYSIYKNLTISEFNSLGNKSNPAMTNKDLEDAKKVYAMMTNIDENIGRVLTELRKQDLLENTLIVFLSDNGPEQNRYRMALRGKKSQVYQGGIKSPCLMSLPGTIPEDKEIAHLTAHIDLLPTILDVCKITRSPNPEIDGRSMMPLLNQRYSELGNRTLFFEWGRGFPIPYQNFAAITDRFKLVANTYQQTGLEGCELFDLHADPEESKNIIKENLPIAHKLKKEMEDWYFKTAAHPNNRKSHPAIVGTKNENPVVLNRNDAKGSPGIWIQEEIFGYWDIRIAESGKYSVKVKFIREISEPGTLFVKLYPFQYASVSSEIGDNMKIDNIFLNADDYRFEVYFQTKSGKRIFPLYASIEKVN